MNLKKTTKPKEIITKSWSAPKVRSFGDATEIIRNVNELGPGDVNFSILLQSD